MVKLRDLILEGMTDEENAVHEQQTEEVSVQEQAKGGKETSEAPEEEKE